MNEQQRQMYLKAMGIQSWFPRFILPAACPSSLYDNLGLQSQTRFCENLAASPSASERANHTCTPSERYATGMIADNTVKKLASPESLSAKQPLSVLSAELAPGTNSNHSPEENHSLAKDVSMTLSFRLAVVVVSENSLVITDIPLAENPSFSISCQRLLHSILFALGWRCYSPSQWQTDIFTWPLAGMDDNLSEKETSEAVQGFLCNRFGLERQQRVLIFGPFSARYTLMNYDSFEQLQGIHTRKNGGNWGCFYSLDQLLKLPELKADVWSQLATLAEIKE